MTVSSASHWGDYSKDWSRFLGTPLKPSERDVRFAFSTLQAALAAAHPGKLLILGATPELVQLPWSAGTRLYAVDRDAGVLARVWKPNALAESVAVEADWKRIPFAAASIDAVAGDGSLNALPGLAHYDDVLREVRRVMAPEGRATIRCFVRSDEPEGVEDIRAATRNGGIAGFHAMKLKLAMSLAARNRSSVAVSDVHAVFQQIFPDREELSRQAGWPLDQIATIDAYRSSDERYSFPTHGEFLTELERHFEVLGQHHSDYEMAENCPTVSLHPLSPGEPR